MITGKAKYFSFILACLFSLETLCFGTTYYVSNTTGSDSNSGLSTTAAWRSLGKANATLRAGDTVLVRAGTYGEVLAPSQAGAAGASITYKNYPGETVVVRGVSGTAAVANIGKAYIVLDGLVFRHISRTSVAKAYDVYCESESADYVTIRNCTFQGTGSAVWGGSNEFGILFSGGDYWTIENNSFNGWLNIGIGINSGAQYARIRGNTITNVNHNNIDFSAQSGPAFYCLVENNLLDYSLTEDGIQFEQNYGLAAGQMDDGSNQKVIIRNNVIRYSQENCIDLKGAAAIVIEGNLLYGCAHNNDGGLSSGNTRYSGAHCIMHGSTADSRDVIIRRNVLYDNQGGVTCEAGYQVYHNSIVYNNRDYTGSNSTWVASDRPAFAGLTAYYHRDNVNIKNNIVGGHHSAEAVILQTSPSLSIDGNLYFNGTAPKLVHYLGISNWHTETWANWPSQLASPILALLDDRHSVNAQPQFVSLPANPAGVHTLYDFALQPSSPAIDAGVWLTTARGSGSGTSLAVQDSRYFCDGYGITAGDEIQLAGQTTTARIVTVNYGTHTLTLDRSLTWKDGQGVALAYQGTAPDIGARESGGTTTTYTLTTSASHGTITRAPNQTSYASGQTVTLTATADSGYTFSGWSGDLTGTTNPATLVMNGDKTVSASFTASPGGTSGTVGNTAVFSLINTDPTRRAAPYTMAEAGQLQSISIYHDAGSGQMVLGVYADSSGVPGSRLGLTNATTVSGSVGWQSVALASPVSVSAGQKIWLAWVFERNPGVRADAGTPGRADSTGTWSGGMPSSFGSSTVLSYIYSIYASYSSGPAASYTLTTSASHGTISRSPDQTSYPSGQTVTLTATADSGYTFSGWSGDLTGTTNPATLVMNANKSVTANFTADAVVYTLTTSATNGTIARAPNQTSYASGQTVTLTATANSGYTFSGWSGDLTGTSNPATLVMNANKSVTANFTADAVVYTLTTSATNGTIARAPDQTSYPSGQTVTLTATANSGYTFSGWSGDLTGSTNPGTLIMDANKSVTAHFAANTYSLTISAVHGVVTASPSKASYTYGEVVTLQAVPDPNYVFSGWSGDASGTSASTTVTMNADKSVVANFTSKPLDEEPPVLTDCSPAPDSIQAPPNALVILHLRDGGAGVDAASVSIRVDGHLVQTGDVDTCRTEYGVCRRLGTKADYTYVYQQTALFDYSRQVTVTVNARDRAGNVMSEQTYAFATEMYSFGLSENVSVDQTSLSQGKPATVGDGQGNIWALWQAGDIGQRNVYATRLVPATDTYGPTVQVSRSTGDHCNPAVAIDRAGTLYAVWQENARGVWDVYLATSVDGTTWSAPRRMVDPALPANQMVDQVNPAVAAGRQLNKLVAIAWQDGRAGNQDIYVACSTDAFTTAAIARVTSDGADQSEPAVAIAGQDAIFVLWTDARTGASNIYGAASNEGPWTNVPVTAGPSHHVQPALAVGGTSPALHLVWVDDVRGDADIFYATAPGLPASPLAGVNIVDDTSGADQQMPAIAVAAQPDGTEKVFVCWEDGRNVAFSGDTDLYFADVSPGALATNVLVGDKGTNSDQSDVALASDPRGYPYLLWSDSAGKRPQIYYAGATYMELVPLVEKEIAAAAGGVVGTPPENIQGVDDVSVAIPAQANAFSVTISIRQIRNPRGYATDSLRVYDFGPSGLTFTQPATITIPYDIRITGKTRAYWFDSATSAFTSDGITNVHDITIGPGLHALQFNAAHFSAYAVSADGREEGGSPCRQGVLPRRR